MTSGARPCVRDRNGIDFIEIEKNEAPPELVVYFLQTAPQNLREANFRITGGRRIRDLAVDKVIHLTNVDDEHDKFVRLILNHTGDLSTYRLCMVKLDEAGKPTDEAPDDFDRRYACLDFNFAANCPSDLDCQVTADCAPPARNEPTMKLIWPKTMPAFASYS